jgi:O-antigen/teichoic acid export membrane protein
MTRESPSLEEGATSDPVTPDSPMPKRGRAPKGLTNRALGGMLWTFSGTGVQAAVQIGVTAALGRLLTPAEFGVMGAAVVVIALSQIVSQIGVGPAIVQRKELDEQHIRTAFTISGGLGFVLGAILWLGAPALARFYRIPEVEPVFRAMALLFPIDGLNTVGESLLSRQLRFRLFVALDVCCYIVGYACIGVFLAWRGYGVWALVAANLSQVTLRTIAMYVATRHSVRPALDVRATKDLLSFGFGHSLAQVALVLSQQGDNMVVGRWLGSAALGIYGRAYSLMVMPATVFGKIVNRVLFPVMAHVQDERGRLAAAYERALAIVALISLPVSAGLWVVAPEFIPALLGPKWTAAVLPFRLFTCGLFFRMSSKITDVVVKAAGAVYTRALIQGIYAALVLVAALIGQRWGIGGVAVTVSVAMGINWLMMAGLGRSVTGLSWTRFVAAQAPGMVVAVLVGGAVALAVHGSRRAHLGGFAVLVVAGVTAGLVALGLWRLRPQRALGPHGAWALSTVDELVRRGPRRGPGGGRGTGDVMAQANPE